jgi:nucleotide-binding universal stress UspA family protein
VTDGVPRESIIRVSDEMVADLVVLGSAGTTSLERVLIGSKARKVLFRRGP